MRARRVMLLPLALSLSVGCAALRGEAKEDCVCKAEAETGKGSSSRVASSSSASRKSAKKTDVDDNVKVGSSSTAETRDVETAAKNSGGDADPAKAGETEDEAGIPMDDGDRPEADTDDDFKTRLREGLLHTRVKVELVRVLKSVGARIKVNIEGHEATLSGTVDDPKVKRLAARTVREVKGVYKVHNHIDVAGEDDDEK